MLHRVSVIGKIIVAVSADQALAVLCDLKHIERYEPKVDAVRVKSETESEGAYFIRGHFAGWPWQGSFSYEIHAHGFRSEMICGPQGVRQKGGFVVKSESAERSRITHYECYQFPRWYVPLLPLIRLYLGYAMRKELRNLAGLLYEIFRPAATGAEIGIDPSARQ